MPVGSTFNDDWYHVERNCNGTISSFNFEVNTTLTTILSSSGEPMFAISILLIALIFFYLAFEVDGEQFELMRILFVFVGIYFIMIALQAMAVMSSANEGLNSVVNLSLQLTGYILYVMIFFLLIQIIRNVFDIMARRKMKVM